MSDIKTSDISFFFGAGASASFDIPTMTQLVVDFEQLLVQAGTVEEKSTYGIIKGKLKSALAYPVDLEAIFTVIDGILNYGPERLGMLSLYSATSFYNPTKKDIATCRSLKRRFQSFVRQKCLIPN